MTDHVLKIRGMRIVFEVATLVEASPGNAHGGPDSWEEPSGAEYEFNVTEALNDSTDKPVYIGNEQVLAVIYADEMAEVVEGEDS